MIYKITYQESNIRNPKREETKSLYIEANTEIEARSLVETNTPFNIEFIQPLDGSHLEYEQKNAAFALTEFAK
ncbi:DNA-directed RNA polymerase subunit epsilon [Carnobacterium funditum]|uniref:DNA-directed RNA polymerase subunit epsilon n=1 Tax=Carnobacterium funditum TaxID=2752 RepID=UPI0005513C1B|nr:DNA-directed RNA polymerase subunit epsilon [Carnobacterium funditum]